MEQYTDLQDWELLQNPDAVPDASSIAGVDHNYFVVGFGEKGQGRREAGLEVEEGGVEEKGEGYFPTDRGGLEGLAEEGPGVDVVVHRAERPVEELMGSGEVRLEEEEEEEKDEEEGEEKGGDSDVPCFDGQSEGVLQGIEVSQEDSDCGGYHEKVEETDEDSDVVRFDDEVKADTDVNRLVEEIEANTDSSDWGFVDSPVGVPRRQFTEEMDEDNSEPGSGNGNKSELVWWKMPLELVKFCVFNVKPVWTISMAAAVVGFALVGWKWYNTRHRKRCVPTSPGVNDKKTSQSVDRSSRLNEAFFLVKHVPLLKTSISNSGITPWPAMASI